MAVNDQIFTYENMLQDGINAYFNTRITTSSGVVKAVTSNYWIQTQNSGAFDGSFVLPSPCTAIAIYSKRPYEYGVLATRYQLTDFSSQGEGTTRTFYMGFEDGAEVGAGLFCWKYERTSGNTDKLMILAAGTDNSSNAEIDVIGLLSTYKSSSHLWQVKVCRDMVYFFVDQIFMGFIIFAPNLDYNISSSTCSGPYGAAVLPSIVGSRMQNTLIELVASTTAGSWDLNAAPYDYRPTDGAKQIPINIFLYKDGVQPKSAWKNSQVGASATFTSAELPTYGYSRKYIRFLADQNGSMVIKSFTNSGNWQTIQTTATAANTYAEISITGDPVIAQASWTNGNAMTAANITEAEFLAVP